MEVITIKKILLVILMSVIVLTACNKEETYQVKADENPIKNIKITKKEKLEVKEEIEKDVLEGYNSKEIEYARVWLQVVGNNETKEINVHYIKSGTPVNEYDTSSANYQEDVILLTGDYMASGSVIYSGNGDGTINIYDVPSHWQEGILPEGETMQNFTSDIIKNTELVYIEPNEYIKNTIKKINIKE